MESNGLAPQTRFTESLAAIPEEAAESEANFVILGTPFP